MPGKPNAPILLITGTDTGVGKTTVACGLIDQLVRSGLAVDVCKPVETGCKRDSSGRLAAEDGIRLLKASRTGSSLDQVVPYRFELPVAPTVAAAAAGAKIDLGLLITQLQLRRSKCDLLVVEGAGGLLVPIAGQATFADLALQLGAAVLVVVGSKLGAINHAALTCSVLQARKIELLGYVLNECYPSADGQSDAVATNRGEIKRVLAEYHGVELAYVEHFSEKIDILESELFVAHSVFTELASTISARLGLRPV